VRALQTGKIDRGERVARPFLRLTMGGAKRAWPERHLLEHGAGEQLARWVLKDEPDVTGTLVDEHPVDGLTGHDDGSFANGNEPHDRAGERRLPGAVLSHDRRRRPARHGHR
jgi:hypothetical protein